MEEFFESMTLIQTQKTERFPVILIDSSFWGPLVEWMKMHQLGTSPYISQADLNLFQITDDVAKAAALIAQFKDNLENVVDSTPYLTPGRAAEGTFTGRQPRRGPTNWP